MILIDADVLGRNRTGDETYVRELLRALPEVAGDLRIAALTRDASLVPEGIEPVVLSARTQELRMAVGVPRLLARLRPRLAHFVHSLPLRCPVPAALTVQDLSWERDPSVFGWWDLLTFKIFVRRSVRRARHVFAISERTKRDLVELYRTPPQKITVTPLAPDPEFKPAREHNSFLLFVSAIEPRKQPLDAIDAANAVGRKLVVVGPKKDAELVAELERRGAEVRGYVPKEELVRLYQSAACLVFPSRYEGFGLPVVEAMACGTPVVAAPEPAMQEVAGAAAVFTNDLAAGVRQALAERERLSAAGLERARAFSWRETARITADVYRKILAG
ncbi:MAG TPA: glycosyltransferase family 1 protein [Gaiellaceae bacterium]|jgi:glycosyltransferase involved in cell wall biosynthesis|nr:glycosyltransferase family 1 protein [Gaiellaceae bacterium]